MKSDSVTTRVIGLRQIADELGVSKSLVSKVLSGRLGTSGALPETITAIRDKAEQLNYRKNNLAEALRAGRQNAITVFVHRHGVGGSSIVEEMITGIAAEANSYRQRLSITYYDGIDDFRVAASDAHRQLFDGVIVGGEIIPEMAADLAKMQQSGLPVVTICNDKLAPSLPNVGMSQTEVGRLATLHLIDAGSRKIACLYTVNVENQVGNERFEGYRQALSERGIEFDAKLVSRVPDFAHVSGTVGTQVLMDSRVDFDGLVTPSDQQAAAAVNILERKGFIIPEQVRVIGVDDSPYCEFVIVPLSSISQEFRQRGEVAVRMLTKLIAGESAESTTFKPRLVIRESTASTVA